MTTEDNKIVIDITSAKNSNGKTFIAYTIAKILQRAGFTVNVNNKDGDIQKFLNFTDKQIGEVLKNIQNNVTIEINDNNIHPNTLVHDFTASFINDDIVKTVEKLQNIQDQFSKEGVDYSLAEIIAKQEQDVLNMRKNKG